MGYNRNDALTRKARQEGFAARSVYKLKEINNKYHIIPDHGNVIDLGAAPGSWLQEVSEKIGPTRRILAFDLKHIQVKLENVTFVKAELTKENFSALIKKNKLNKVTLVISDMAPNTTGVRDLDQVRSYELCLLALEVAKTFLETDGNFVCKMFESEFREDFEKELKIHFAHVKLVRPKSTRSTSKEIFFMAKEFFRGFELKKKSRSFLN
ncbi:MAG: RlmE family RNA methyltransferase [Candidatus Woesearchaeota archaeon]|nr:MAG: RlmE family RNA methyltransferase [Candidatus Woesearchaeota archaeon]